MLENIINHNKTRNMKNSFVRELLNEYTFVLQGDN